jgi:hypothetical protein
MHVKIAYYSRKGTTAGLAEMVSRAISARGHQVTMVPIKHVKKRGFLMTGRASIKMADMELDNEAADFDLVDADLVIVGGPIFAGKVDPHTRTYLNHASGLEGKPGGVLITCGAGPDDDKGYLREMEGLVSARGLKVRARLFGSNKLKDRYQEMAERFASEVLEGLGGSGE